MYPKTQEQRKEDLVSCSMERISYSQMIMETAAWNLAHSKQSIKIIRPNGQEDKRKKKPRRLDSMPHQFVVAKAP